MTWVDLLRSWDHRLFFAINGLAESAPVFLAWTTELGNVFVLMLLLLAGLAVWDRGSLRKRFPWLCLTVLGARVAAQGLKFIVQRPRPSVYFADALAQGRVVIHTFPGLRHSHTSFPSGHAVAAFAAVTALCLLYGRKFRFLYIPAALVAFSRVYIGAHFPSDVIAGAGIGTAVALAAGLFLDKKK